MNTSHTMSLSLIMMATMLLGCSNEKKLNEEVNLEFGKILNDPTSLELRNVKYFNDDTVCGEFNSKNDKGGYVGFKPFIYQKNGVLGGEWYEAALGRGQDIKDPRYAPLIHTLVKIASAEKALSEFPKSPFVIAGRKSMTEAMWLESTHIWCSNLSSNEKLKSGKSEFIKLLLQSFNNEYISVLESDCNNRKRAYNLYMDAALLGNGYSQMTASGLSVDSESACKAVKSAKDIVQAASDNLAQINSKSTK